MNQSAIFAPMFGMLVLTFIVWVYMYARRIPFIQASQMSPEQLARGDLAKLSPPYVVNPSDNLKNLFELPIVFYVTCFYLFTTNQVDNTYVGSAWFFLTFRILHSAMHCTVNVVIARFTLYAIASAACWFMVARALLQYLA